MKKKIIAICLIVVLALSLTACVDNSKMEISTTTMDVKASLGVSGESITASLASGSGVELASLGKASLNINVNQTTGEGVESAAVFMQTSLRTMVGDPTGFEIRRSDSKCEGINIGFVPTDVAIEDDGYCIDIVGSERAISIAGSRDAGTINGVYGFLEDYLECMFARYDYNYLPNAPTIRLDEGRKIFNPDFAWRKVFAYETAQNEWYKRLRMNGTDTDNTEEQSGWGTWCHNVFQFVDPKIYFESNPEFYAMIGRERKFKHNGQTTQLCLTNPDIYPIIEAKMAELMAAEPDKTYWDFSLNDNYMACECSVCKKVAAETGSMMGTMLPIINRLAAKFPDKTISTLAYFYNVQPPSNLGFELLPNVNIVIAPIGSSQMHSMKFGESATTQRAKELIEEWGKYTENILIWDYVVSFNHLLMPFPNFEVQRDNLQFYKDNKVTSVFHQASREYNDEFANLRGYIMSRQLWNIDVDINKLIAKYLTVTYGAADVFIAEYIDTTHALLKEKATDLDLYHNVGMHGKDYLSKGAIEKYRQLMDSAMAAVAGDEVIISRLEEIKINILFAKMKEVSYDFKGREEAFHEWAALVGKHGITRFNEGDSPQLTDYINGGYLKELYIEKLNLGFAIASPLFIAAGLAVLIPLVMLVVKKIKRRRMLRSSD